MPLLLIAALLTLLAAAPAAYAGDSVLVVGEDRIERRWDAHLPPDPQPLTPDPPAARAAAGPTVRQALDGALERGRIGERRHGRYLQVYRDAKGILGRRGVLKRCRNQMGRQLGVLRSIAARGQLTPARMPALFLQLERNTEFWEREPRIRLGERVSFGDDPLLLQHYAGYGLQIQPLGNFGKANGLWTECEERPRECRPKMLRRLLDSMLGVASHRGGAKAWEYWFPFSGGYPPWASGMAQATGMQALARGATFFGEPRFMEAARRALPLFEKAPATGVRVKKRRGSHYVLYSFAPGLRVLNGFLQAITGLHDYARLNRDRRAQRLWRAGDRAARREVPRYDTGRWSYYALPNRNLASWDYHVLVTGFLENLCERVGARVYCRTARRFNRYSERRGGPPPPGTPGEGRRCGYM